MNPSELALCSWGDIRVFASSIQWDGGNTVVVHELANGDEHPVQPRGRRLRKHRATLLFDDFEGASETGEQALARFQAAVDAGERRLFRSPLGTSFIALVGDFEPTVDEHSNATATCEFIPDGAVEPVSPAGAGTTGTTGETSVIAALDQAAAAAATVGVGFPPDVVRKMDFSRPIPTNISLAFELDVEVAVNVSVSASFAADVKGTATGTARAEASAQANATASVLAFASVFAEASAEADASAVAQASGMASASAFAFAYAAAALDADARASVASWNETEEPDINKVLVDTARLSESLAAMIEIGRFEEELALWPAFRAAILLGESIRSAAIAATSEAPRVFLMRIQTRTSLLALCARTYGGALATERARQILALNSIRTRGWLDPGDYLFPAKTSADTPSSLGGL